MEDKSPENIPTKTIGLTRDDIIEILKNETFYNTLHQFIEHNQKTQFWKTVSFVMMAFLGIGGFFLAWQSNLDANQVEATRLHDERMRGQIDRKIKNKIAWMREADQAMIELRKTREFIVLNCKYHHPFSLYDQTLLRSRARFDLNKAFTGIDFVFNEQVHDQFHKYIEFDENIPDVCAPNTPNDAVYLKASHNLISLMGKSIQQDEENLEKFR